MIITQSPPVLRNQTHSQHNVEFSSVFERSRKYSKNSTIVKYYNFKCFNVAQLCCMSGFASSDDFNIKPLPSHPWNWEMYPMSLRKVSSVPVSRAEAHFWPADLHLIQINETRSQLKGENTVCAFTVHLLSTHTAGCGGKGQ